MIHQAHAGGLLSEASDPERWNWGSPVGLGVFIVAVALTLALLAWTIKTLSNIEAQEKKRK